MWLAAWLSCHRTGLLAIYRDNAYLLMVVRKVACCGDKRLRNVANLKAVLPKPPSEPCELLLCKYRHARGMQHPESIFGNDCVYITSANEQNRVGIERAYLGLQRGNSGEISS